MTMSKYISTSDGWIALSEVPDLSDEEVTQLYRETTQHEATVLYYAELRARGLSIPTPEEVDEE